MRRFAYLPWLFLLTVLAARAAADEAEILEPRHIGEVTARLSVDVADPRDSPKAQVTMTVEVEGPEGLEVEEASLEDPVKAWEILKLKPTMAGTARQTWMQKIHLKVKKPGPDPLPTVSVRFRPTVGASWERAEWSGILDRTAPGPPLERPPSLSPPPDWRRGVLWVAGVLVLWLVLVASRYWRRPPVVLGPRERALSELDALSGAASDPIAVHDHLAQTLRTYLAGRFGVPAGQRTTDELQAMLGAVVDLAPEQQKRVHALLSRCDAVRFGGGACTREEMNTTLTEARQFLGQSS